MAPGLTRGAQCRRGWPSVHRHPNSETVMSESPAVGGGQHKEVQLTDTERVMPGQSAPVPTAQEPATAQTRPAVDVRQLRHPSEPSRFALAASASILLVGLGLLVILRLTGFAGLAAVGGFLLLVLGSVWWLV